MDLNLNTVKFVVRHGVSWCVGTTVIMLVKQNTHPDTKGKKAQTVVGGVAMALMIEEQVGAYTDKWIDVFADALDKKEDPVVVRY